MSNANKPTKKPTIEYCPKCGQLLRNEPEMSKAEEQAFDSKLKETFSQPHWQPTAAPDGNIPSPHTPN